MDFNRVQQYTDIIHENISYSGLEGAVMSTPIFNRLHHVLQSSLVYLTYSSNKVKRFEHSVGTMFLSGEMFYNSVLNSSSSSVEQQLLSEMKLEISKWYESIDVDKERMLDNVILDKYNAKTICELAPVPTCPLYEKYFPNHISKDMFFPYAVFFQSIRLAGLLHDVGHLPYSHVFEYAAKLLYSMIDEVKGKNTAQESFIKIMQPYCKGDNELHEELGISLLKQIKMEVFSYVDKISEENLFVIAVFYFTEQILRSSPVENNLFSDIHRIISSSLDADRLDYCTRDSFCSGLNKFIFPYKRLFSTYRIMNGNMPYDYTESATQSVRERVLFCPALKNISEIEELLERRWNIFTKINYHHRVHKHEIIFSEILAHLGFDELKNMDSDIPNISIGKPIPLKVWSIWAITKLLKENKRSIDYLIIQLDDSWMDTLLKNAFFEKYNKNYRNKSVVGSDEVWNMFDELISTQKHYYSYFKRSVDFISFDAKIRDAWLNQYKKSTGRKEINRIREKINTVLENQKNNKIPSKFSLSLIFSELNINEIAFYQEVEKEANQWLKENGDVGIKHCLIRPCKFSLGYNVKTPIYLWNTAKTTKSFTQVSQKVEYIQQQKDLYLPFHLYYLPCEDFSDYNCKIFENIIIDIIVSLVNKHYTK